MDEHRPFRFFAGIVDGVTDAHFRFDQEEAERIMTATGEREAHVPADKEVEHA